MPQLQRKSGMLLIKRTSGEKRRAETKKESAMRVIGYSADMARFKSSLETSKKMLIEAEEKVKQANFELESSKKELAAVRIEMENQRKLLLNLVEAQSATVRAKISKDLLGAVNSDE